MAPSAAMLRHGSMERPMSAMVIARPWRRAAVESSALTSTPCAATTCSARALPSQPRGWNKKMASKPPPKFKELSGRSSDIVTSRRSRSTMAAAIGKSLADASALAESMKRSRVKSRPRPPMAEIADVRAARRDALKAPAVAWLSGSRMLLLLAVGRVAPYTQVPAMQVYARAKGRRQQTFQRPQSGRCARGTCTLA
jgi:hypothetical protein